MELWEIPPFPSQGDKAAQTTYAAVGNALSEWERLELYFARLYAAFIGMTPLQAISNQPYKDATIFAQRARVIEYAAETYFLTHHDQSIEGDFKNLICDARRFADRRNDIAHGVVNIIWFDGSNGETLDEALVRDEYMLTPSTYKAKAFEADRTPKYLLNSVEIDRFAERFRAMRLERVEPLLIRVLQQRGS